MEWYIKLHRKFMEWEWYKNWNVFTVFIHCLLKANWKDKKWEWDIIKRWEFITSYQTLANELSWKHNKFTVMQVRTALKKLNVTGEITIKTTNKFTIVKVNNYNEYQVNNTQDNNQITNKQQTNNNQITTTKNDKNDKNEKNINTKPVKIKIFQEDSFEYSISKFFLNHLVWVQEPSILYQLKKKSEDEVLQSWASEVDRMLRIDMLTPDQVRYIVEFTVQDEFWSTVILSMLKFRKKNKDWVPYLIVIIGKIKDFKKDPSQLSENDLLKHAKAEWYI